MTTTPYAVPANPPDPEARRARVDRSAARGHPAHRAAAGLFRTTARCCCAEGAFAGLPWADAKMIAAAVAFDMCKRDDAEAFMPTGPATYSRAPTTCFGRTAKAPRGRSTSPRRCSGLVELRATFERGGCASRLGAAAYD